MSRKAASKAKAPDVDGGDVRDWIGSARRIAILTGAGMSAESGVPTFRDALTGVWSRHKPEDLATEAAYRANPQMVWDWYTERRERLAGVEPNAGHLAIAAFQARHPDRLTVITQNVDGLHQRAGTQGVLALHGNLSENRWLDGARECCNLEALTPGSPPRCVRCGNPLRPSVVWFGESLAFRTLARAEASARHCDLMLVVGTSGMVYPAAGLPGMCKGKVVIVNPQPSEIDGIASLVIRGTAATVLPDLLA